MISKKSVYMLAAGTLIFFGGLGLFLIPKVRSVELITYLAGYKSITFQLATGLVVGYITAMAAWQIVDMPRMEETKKFFATLIQPLRLTRLQILLISICAGVGEELFFRGAIQPLAGIWVTSFLFVLLHGYINPRNWPLTIYGLYMVAVIGVLGLFTEHFGIITAIAGHLMIDYVLLRKLSETIPE